MLIASLTQSTFSPPFAVCAATAARSVESTYGTVGGAKSESGESDLTASASSCSATHFAWSSFRRAWRDATKPEFAGRMLDRALDAGVPAGWVTGDEAYGQVSALRLMLEGRGMSYVLAVPSNQRVHPAGHTIAEGEMRIDAAVAALAADPGRARWNGRSLSSGGLAREYGFTDLDGSQPDCWRYVREVQDPGKPAEATGYR